MVLLSRLLVLTKHKGQNLCIKTTIIQLLLNTSPLLWQFDWLVKSQLLLKLFQEQKLQT